MPSNNVWVIEKSFKIANFRIFMRINLGNVEFIAKLGTQLEHSQTLHLLVIFEKIRHISMMVIVGLK